MILGVTVGQSIDADLVADHVSRLYRGEAVQILDWTADSLKFRTYAESTHSILTISGSACWRGRNRKWRMLLKQLQRPSRNSPDYHGWDREITAYERLPPNILSNDLVRAPKFLGADRPTRSTARLWLEYVSGKPAASWSLSEWRTFTSALATIQTEFVADSSLLSQSWLNHEDLRRWVDSNRARFFPIRITDSLEKLLAPYFKPTELVAVSALWQKRNHLLDRLDRIPATLCHNDIWSGNALLEQREGSDALFRPVIFDWQLVGPGPIAGDLAFTVVAGVWLMFFPGTWIKPLERALLSGYVDGLKKAGKKKLVPAVKESFALTAALRYALMLPQLLNDIIEPGRMSEVMERSGAHPDHILENRAKLIKVGVRWAFACGIK